MKYGMTGTRKGITTRQEETFVYALRKYPKLDHLVHGDCEGADEDIHWVARTLQHSVTIRPCDLVDQRACVEADHEHEPKKPLDRNKDIVHDVKVMFAFPSGYKELTRGSGTWATIRYARNAKKLLYIIYPDGSVDSSGV